MPNVNVRWILVDGLIAIGERVDTEATAGEVV
jgi:hypothetical protein